MLDKVQTITTQAECLEVLSFDFQDSSEHGLALRCLHRADG